MRMLPLPCRIMIALCSIVTMAFVLFISRILIVSQWYHFLFMTLTAFFIGHALGILISQSRHPHNLSISAFSVVIRAAIGICISINLVYTLYNWSGLDTSQLIFSAKQTCIFFLFFLLLCIPALINGWMLGILSRASSVAPHTFFCFSLFFSGLGAFLELGFWHIYPSSKHLLLWSFMMLVVLFFCLSYSKQWNRPRLFFFLSMTLFMFYISAPTYYKYHMPATKEYMRTVHTTATPCILQRISHHLFYSIYTWTKGSLPRPFCAPSHARRLPTPTIVSVNGNNPVVFYPVPLHSTDLSFTQHLLHASPYQLNSIKKICLVAPGGNQDLLTGIAYRVSDLSLIDSNPSLLKMHRLFTAHTHKNVASPLFFTQYSYRHHAWFMHHPSSFDLIVLGFPYSAYQIERGGIRLERDTLYSLQTLQGAFSALRENGIIAISLPIAHRAATLRTIMNTITYAASCAHAEIYHIRNGYYQLLLIRTQGLFSPHQQKTLHAFCMHNQFHFSRIYPHCAQRTCLTYWLPFPFRISEIVPLNLKEKNSIEMKLRRLMPTVSPHEILKWPGSLCALLKARFYGRESIRPQWLSYYHYIHLWIIFFSTGLITILILISCMHTVSSFFKGFLIIWSSIALLMFLIFFFFHAMWTDWFSGACIGLGCSFMIWQELFRRIKIPLPLSFLSMCYALTALTLLCAFFLIIQPWPLPILPILFGF